MEEKQNRLATEPIGTLLFQFALPTTMTLIVNSLYNLVDQLFLGRAVGIGGVAATNVAFPLFIISAAFALMIGDGCGANMSLALGRKENEKANKLFGQALFLLLLASSILFIGGQLALKPMLQFFGATPSILDMSASYTRIVLWGIPFSMANMAFSAMIRADGNPKYMMKTMMIGAGINLVLDPILIYGFSMGVAGAGYATIIGQFVSGTMALAYIPKLKHIQFKKEYIAFHPDYALPIVKLGFSSFATQGATALTQIVLNNLLGYYGAMTVYGSEIALSCFGIMTKLYQISHAMFVGVGSGIQPIIGFNFGAKKYKRVKETYTLALKVSLVISILWFGIFQLGGVHLAKLFIDNDPLYLDFAQHLFQIYMLAFFLYGPPQISASFFQGIGKPLKALSVAVCRQLFFLIPFALLFSTIWGLDGILFAAPLADALAFVFAAIMIMQEFYFWKKQDMI